MNRVVLASGLALTLAVFVPGCRPDEPLDRHNRNLGDANQLILPTPSVTGFDKTMVNVSVNVPEREQPLSFQPVEDSADSSAMAMAGGPDDEGGLFVNSVRALAQGLAGLLGGGGNAPGREASADTGEDAFSFDTPAAPGKTAPKASTSAVQADSGGDEFDFFADKRRDDSQEQATRAGYLGGVGPDVKSSATEGGEPGVRKAIELVNEAFQSEAPNEMLVMIPPEQRAAHGQYFAGRCAVAAKLRRVEQVITEKDPDAQGLLGEAYKYFPKSPIDAASVTMTNDNEASVYAGGETLTFQRIDGAWYMVPPQQSAQENVEKGIGLLAELAVEIERINTRFEEGRITGYDAVRKIMGAVAVYNQKNPDEAVKPKGPKGGGLR